MPLADALVASARSCVAIMGYNLLLCWTDPGGAVGERMAGQAHFRNLVNL